VASKHAVEGLSKSAALEAAGSGVRVNVVARGPIETGLLNRFTGTDDRKAGLVAGVPLKRVGRPEEIAQTIVFVASDKAPFITGASGQGSAEKLEDSLRSLCALREPAFRRLTGGAKGLSCLAPVFPNL
jgi:short-subunit dehydrogenase